MGGDDARGNASRIVRTHHYRRLTAFLLGRRARKKSHALQRRTPGRQLADRAYQRPGWRQVRWRVAGAEFREPEPRQHALDKAIQYVVQGRYRGTALPGL